MQKSDNHIRNSIGHKLTRKGVVQSSLVALIAVLSIVIATVVFQRLLIHQTLTDEAVHFWQNYQLDSEFQVPETAYLRGYLTGGTTPSGVPEKLKKLELGFHRPAGQNKKTLLYITEDDDQRLYLLYDTRMIGHLSNLYVALPVALAVLILIFFTAWWVYRESAKILRPIIWLANRLDRFDPSKLSTSVRDLGPVPGNVDWEVENLIVSFLAYSERIRQLIDREQAFTRDVSHEFRSPLTVIKLASDLVLSDPDVDPFLKKYITRIKSAARVMEELVDAFLILARESDSALENTPVKVADIVANEMRVAESFKKSKDLFIELDVQYPLQLVTEPKVLSIAVGHLIRNAVSQTAEGGVTITILEHALIVRDTGIGMADEKIDKTFKAYPEGNENELAGRSGAGVGLTIVKRLADRFGWILKIESEFGVGTAVTLDFVGD